MASKTPDFTAPDYVKFFSAGALAATLTHGVRIPSRSIDVVHVC